MPVKILDLKVVHHQSTFFPFNNRSNSKIKIKTIEPTNKWNDVQRDDKILTTISIPLLSLLSV